MVINKNHKKFLKNKNLKNIKIIIGGKNRSESSLIALKSIKKNKISKVFIHDAARPNFSLKLISKLFKELKKNKCVIPVIKTNNSVKFKYKNKITNIERLKVGFLNKSSNSILIKLNQIGTVSETLEVIKFAQLIGFSTIVSHRSGESEDTFISDLAVGTNSNQIKTGSLARSERVAKYNQLIRIEEKLGKSAKMNKIN